MLPDFIQDLKSVGLSDDDLTPLFRSAEHYVAMWERIGARGTAPPTTAVTITPLPNDAGWDNSDVSITLAATAAPGGQGVSGITYGATGAHPISTTTAPGAVAGIAVTQEGSTELTFHARDLGGAIESTRMASIRIDRTPPLATAIVTPSEPNEAGWYNTPVVVSFTGSDALSGLASCDDPVTLSTDGSALWASGRCRDAAGNQSEQARAEGINIDRTPPQLTAPAPFSFEATQPLTPIAGSEALTEFFAAASAQDALDPSPEIGHDAPLELPLGTTTVTFLATDRADNATEAETTITMRGRPTLSWSPSEIVYGTAIGNGQLNAAASFAGAPLPGIFQYSPPATAVLDAGEHDLSVTFTPDDPSKYVGGSLTARLRVRRAPLTLTPANALKVYGASLPPLAHHIIGFVNNDTEASLDAPVLLSTTATAASDVGQYEILSSGAADANYEITFLNGTLTITPAPLTVAAENKEMIAGGPLPVLTVAASGFVNNDTLASLDVGPSLHTAATGEVVGAFPITVSGARDRNYDISFIGGRLSVIYAFGGFSGPIEPGGTYRANRTLPLMFSLSFADGTPATAATATLRVDRVGPDNALGDPLDIDLAGAADEGNVFRFSGNHYQFNLRTNGWSAGRYRFTVTLNDGRNYWMDVVLR